MALSEKQVESIEAAEKFLVDVQADIYWLMEHKEITSSMLAKELGVSQSRISQIFGSEPENLTLKTLGKIFHVLGEDVTLTSHTLNKLKLAAQTRWPKEEREKRGVIASLLRCLVDDANRSEAKWSSGVVNDNDPNFQVEDESGYVARRLRRRVESDKGRPIAVMA